MKKFYCIILVLIIFGSIMGYLCLPGTTETALMHYESSNYHAAIKNYQDYIDKTGDISTEVIVNLSKLYLNIGEPEKAISLIQSYVLKTPDSFEAKKLLSDYFKSTHKTADLIQTTEEIAKLNPSVDVYKILFELYNIRGHIDKIAETLNKMIVQKDYITDEKDFRALIYYYASKSDYLNAERIINTLLSKKDYRIKDSSTYNLIVNVLLDSGKLSKAYEISKFFCNENFALNQKIQIASEFKRKYPEKTLSLLLDLKTKNRNDKQLQFVILDTKLILKRKEEVLNELQELAKQENLTGNLLDLYFSLIISSKDKTAIQEAIKKYNILELSDENLILLASYCLIDHDIDSANIMTRKLGNEFLYDYPLLNLVLSSTQYNKDLSYVVNRILDRKYFISTDLALIYADSLYNNKDFSQCEQLLAGIPLERICREFSSEAFVTTAFKTKQLKKYLNNLSLLANKNNNKVFETCETYLTFLVASGETEKFQNMLYSLKDNNRYFDLLESSFITSQNFMRKKLALKLAKEMCSIHYNKKSKLFLIEAYLLNNKYVEAEKIFKPFEIDNKETALLYLNILTQTSEFKKGEYTKLSAKSKKAINIIFSDKSTEEELRTVGYFYAAVGNTKKAINIFFNLAKNNKYNGVDTEQLIALCTQTSNKKVVDWITNKANIESTISEKNYWLKALNEIGKSETVISILNPTFSNKKIDFKNIDFQGLKNTFMKALYLQSKYKLLISHLDKIDTNDYQFSPLKINTELFDLLVSGGYYKKAYEILANINSNDAISELDPIQVARVFIKNEKIKTGINYLQKNNLKELKNNLRIDEAILLLHAAVGNSTPIIEWITNQGGNNTTLLSDFFYTALDSKQKDAAYQIAKTAYSKNPSSFNRTIYLDALLAIEKYEEIVSIIAFPSEINETEIYLQAVTAVLLKNKINDNIHNSLNILYHRIINGNFNTSKEQRRTLGYILSDLNKRNKAKEIFFQLAKDQSVNSPDVEQLLFLIGDKTNQKEKEWLIARANNSYGDTMIKWCKYLNQTNNPEYTIKIMEKHGILEN